MHQRKPRPWAYLPRLRLLLLGLLVVGLLQMHSFGHTSHDPGTAGLSLAAGDTAAGHMDASAPGGSPHAPPAPESGGMLELLMVCLAVLTSVGLIGALITILAARAAAGRHPQAPLARLFAARGPPAAAVPLIGHRLARLSVLRI